MVCFGGDYTESGQYNAPYRGLDSTYTNRYCSSGQVETDADSVPIGVTPSTSDELCNHYSPEEVAQLPTMAEHVKAAVDFLGMKEEGFFLMYEQGDVSSIVGKMFIYSCGLISQPKLAHFIDLSID